MKKQVIIAIIFVVVIILVFMFFIFNKEEKNDAMKKNEKGEVKKGKEYPLNIKWEQLQSPPGGGYWTISISLSNPETVIVASRDFNVIKSTDGGKSWKMLGEKLFGAHIFSNIAIHPSDPDQIFISNGAIHYTNDGGAMWEAVSTEKIGSGENEGVTALAYNSKNPNIMYAGEGNDFFISSDEGKNWINVGSVEGSSINSIIKKEEALYVMANDFGVFKSIDNGKTWTRKNSGIDEFDYIYGMFNYRYLAYNELSSEFYLATENGLYVSSDGEHWQKKGPFQNENLPITVAAIGSIIYVTTESGKLYKTSDGGETWEVVYIIEDIKLHHGFNYAVSVHNSQPNIVYVVTDDIIIKSIDDGKTWQEISKEIYDDAFFVMNYASDTGTLWVGAYWTRGLFTTKDEGKSWNFIESWRHTELQDHYPMSININPLNNNEVYVSGAYGLKKTEDNGKTWKSIAENTSIYDKHIHGLGMSAENPKIIYAGNAPGWDQDFQTSKIFKTVDSGETWNELTNFPSREENNVYAFAIVNNTIYVALNQHESEKSVEHHNALGVWKSFDGGKTWQDVSSNLPNKNAFSIAVHPQNQDIVYAGLGHTGEDSSEAEQGLFRSKDGGKSWQRIEGLPELQPSKIRFHPKNLEIILVSFGEHICGACGSGNPKGAGVYGTIDGGKNWYNLVYKRVLTERQMAVMDLVFKDDDTIYIVTDDGLFKGILEIK